MTPYIKLLRERLEDYQGKLRETEEALNRALCEHHGISPGTIVKGRGGNLYKVARVHFDECLTPFRLDAHPQRKNGSYSKDTHVLYQWEK